ncbi:hypothetical protein OG211_14685 [Streptomyces niveus]|uniref:hypothetical protein n=1 Tax=Streptomyces niveus TaxID=193462 RepID=UPI00386E176F|nr:hypothetical protein OG211_14685 [Streptomyces niveus]
MAASPLVHGQMFSYTNLGGGDQSDLHPVVLKFFDTPSVEQREPFIGCRAESALVSEQL